MTTSATPQKLYLMQVAARTDEGVANPVPYACYLVELSDGEYILIDSGFPADLPERPGLQLGLSVIEQLAVLDIQPGAIKTLICTHFDRDHCGHHEDFPNAELIVQREHYETAHGGHPRFTAGRAHWDFPVSRYRFVDGDTVLIPGLELIETGGHVPGHQSVLLRLPESGPVLLAIDAVPDGALFLPDRPATSLDLDRERVVVSANKLLNLVQREQVALVIFGHDGAQWPTLKKLPEFYQ